MNAVGVWQRPRVVPEGGVLGICAPSGPVNAEHLAYGLAALGKLGFQLVLAPGLLERREFLAGDDATRLGDLHRLLADPRVHAVVCARGGYGAMRLLPDLDLEAWRRNPKPLVGFSDITALHLALGSVGVGSLHGMMVEAGPDGPPPGNLRSLQRALCSREPLGTLVLPSGAAPTTCLLPGRAAGVLVGGNLSLMCATLGTPWEIQTRDRLLLLEEVGESPYRLDRLLAQMWLAGKLQEARGFVVGELVNCGDGSDGQGGEAVLREWLGRVSRPAIARLPLGHGQHRLTVPLGARAEIDAERCTLTFLESAVA